MSRMRLWEEQMKPNQCYRTEEGNWNSLSLLWSLIQTQLIIQALSIKHEQTMESWQFNNKLLLSHFYSLPRWLSFYSKMFVICVGNRGKICSCVFICYWNVLPIFIMIIKLDENKREVKLVGFDESKRVLVFLDAVFVVRLFWLRSGVKTLHGGKSNDERKHLRCFFNSHPQFELLLLFAFQKWRGLIIC